MLTAATILSIPADAPQLLFRGAAAEVPGQYRALAMRWHPDRPGNQGSAHAGEVFRKVAALKQAADALIAAGDWFVASGEAGFVADDGRRLAFAYAAHRRIELGHLLIGRERVAFLVRPEFADLYANGITSIRAMCFADDAMRTEFQPQLPRLAECFATAEYRVLILDKDPEAVSLADLLHRAGGKLPAAHMAWLTSRCLNLACWLDWARVFHGDIGADSLFVNPRLHSVALLGGWWYATPLGGRLAALPQRSMRLMPSDLLRDKRAQARGDLETIRALGRELLGDPAGTCLGADADVPAALSAWAQQAGGSSAIEDFQGWQGVLQRAFGPRRFVELPLSFDDVYPQTPTD